MVLLQRFFGVFPLGDVPTGSNNELWAPAGVPQNRVAVSEPPVDGKANAACRRAIAAALGCARGDVQIDPTSKGRRKRVKIQGDVRILSEKLMALALELGLG